MRIIWIALLGSVGALARYELSRAIHHRTERVGMATMVVNLVGAILLGCLLGIDARAPTDPDLLTAGTVGFLGGFTTFSTWMVDVVVLAENGHRGRRRAALNLAMTLVGGIIAYSLARLLVAP
jgi:CrcB protein